MPNINEYGYNQCFLGETEFDNIIFNNLEDGTIEVFIDENGGVGSPSYVPTPVGAMCCQFINLSNSDDQTFEPHPNTTGHTYTWDEDRQECRWLKYADCDNLPAINVVLNPNGNYGAIFDVDGDETCVLNVEFDYMFKFDCQDILDVQNTPENQLLTSLYNDLDTYTTLAISTQEELDNLDGGFNYVLPYNSNSIFLCITEAGLPLLETTINDVQGAGAWELYLSGALSPYDLNEQVALIMGFANVANQGLYLNDCTADGPQLISDTYSWITSNNNLTSLLNGYNATIESLNEQINDILDANAQGCLYAIDTFEELIVNMAIDLQDPNQPSLVNTVYTEEIFNIGQGNLLSYLTENVLNPMYMDGFEWITCDGSPCNALANVLSQQLIDQGNEEGIFTGTTFLSQYNQLLSLIGDGSFNPTWYHYSGTISDPAIISGLTGGSYVNLSLQIADSCVDMSILLDRIELNKVCERVKTEEIFVSKNPGFDIRKECDNKKSWIYTEAPEERDYEFGMRNTDYNTNDSRLVLNTKEVDLNVSIDNGIETDVWCYVNDNPCILESCTPEYDIITITGSSCSSTPNLTGATNWTGGTNTLPTINMGVDPNFSGEMLRLNWAANGTAGYPASAFTTTQYGDCAFIHKINIQATSTSPTRFNGAWIVGNYDGTVDWFYNRSWSGNTELITQYSDTISGETGCNIVMSGISEYNTLQGTDFTNVYWDSATSACTFMQPPAIITGSTIINDCCCDEIPLSGTNVTGGTIALPSDSATTICDWVVGGIGPAGGIIYWIDPTNPCAGYEVSTTDQATTVLWCNLTNEVGTSTDFGTGSGNTDAILANCTDPATAADFANNYISVTGYDDWFLPSIDDLVLIADNTNALSALTNEEAYWSSSEVPRGAVGNTTEAYLLYGSYTSPSGYAVGQNKKTVPIYRVRAVRYFDTSPCNTIISDMNLATVVSGIGEEYPDCDSWIYKFNAAPPFTGFFSGWWVAGMPDDTVGLFQQTTISGSTASTVDFTNIMSQDCCENINTLIQDYAWDSAKGDYYTEFFWDINCQACKFKRCEKPECVDYTELLTTPVTGITTVKVFNDVISSELINARCRKISSSYPTLRALYERYMNSTQYCDTQSSAFDYFTMSDFANLVGTYWVDLFEQVIPSTTIWCANHIHGNTIYDQQKFKYRGYSMYPCGTEANSGAPVESPLPWTVSGAADVDVYTISNEEVCVAKTQCTSGVYYVTGDCGSEFLGKVTVTSSS